jgi:hypothetical protein
MPQELASRLGRARHLLQMLLLEVRTVLDGIDIESDRHFRRQPESLRALQCAHLLAERH